MNQGDRSGEPSAQRLMAWPYLAAAAMLLVATALLTLLSVFWRGVASADEPTLAASLAAIAENRGPYLAAGATRLAAGTTLLLGALCLGRTGAAPGWVVPLLVLSGLLTLLSGAFAVVLGLAFAGIDPAGGDALAPWAAPVEGATAVHRVSGIAFLLWLTLAGVGLLGGRGPWWGAGARGD